MSPELVDVLPLPGNRSDPSVAGLTETCASVQSVSSKFASPNHVRQKLNGGDGVYIEGSSCVSGLGALGSWPRGVPGRW